MKLKPGDLFETSLEGGCFAVSPSRDGDRVTWYVPFRWRGFEIKRVLIDTVEEFRFIDTLDREFFLRPMTLEAYRERIQPVVGGADVDTLDELIERYQRI